jgi:hypothetical protein
VADIPVHANVGMGVGGIADKYQIAKLLDIQINSVN